jgi:transcriptional regulator with XRE-family HTH domain
VTPDDLSARFGARLRELRVARSYSQEAFAALANIDRSAYGKLERGRSGASLTTMARIAVALEVPLAELVSAIELDPKSVRAWPRMARGPAPFRPARVQRKGRPG